MSLDALKGEIEGIGNQIRDLKASGDGSSIPALVQQLNTLKQSYADQNNGLGVDGKPYVPPMSKAEKKKWEKEQKAKKAAEAASAASTSGNAPTQTPANAAKKEAKKQAKQAAKQAAKAGGGAIANGSNGASKGNHNNKNAASGGATAKQFVCQVAPMQMIINPNQPLQQRPVVALTMAILENIDANLTISSDHRISQSLLGLAEDDTSTIPNTATSIVGDLSMARYLVGHAQRTHGKGTSMSLASAAIHDQWLDYASAVSKLPTDQARKGIAMTLEHTLGYLQTYVCTASIGPSLADVALFAALGFPSQAGDATRLLEWMKTNKFVAASRWLSMMIQLPAIQRATQLALGVNGIDEVAVDATSTLLSSTTATSDKSDGTATSNGLDPLVSGMNLLEGAIPGHVVTRFPPEPSGYLHVGHAKAVLLNDYYARRYKGRLIVRFDDTNPSKEKEEYQQSIVEDLKRLGVEPDVVTYTSDYFATIHGYATQMIQQGLAYMDDTAQEQMKQERADRIESNHRKNQSPQEALELFQLLCSGKPEGAPWCLRAKIDMSSDNGTMRDPVLYRQNLTPHHRSGTTFKAYPTYDLACPIVDSLEGVTHALRTTEYNDRDEQYAWIQSALNIRRVRIHAFSRVNFVYTVLSKRKLAWFVEQGLVEGWGDARFPTVRGVVRRGVDIQALRQFIYSQGASRRVVNMEWNKFWSENKKELDKTAKRFMAIDEKNSIPLTIVNQSASAYLTTSFHPKDPSLGSRAIQIGKSVLLENADCDGMTVGENIVLLRWGVVKLTKVDKDGSGAITSVEGEFIPGGDFKAAKRKLSWLVDSPTNTNVVLTEFDYLVTKEKLEEDDKFEDFVNPTTIATTEVKGDAGLKMLQEHDVIQLERRGYYRVDRPYVNPSKPLVLYMVPDGKSKSMSGQAGKLAHH